MQFQREALVINFQVLVNTQRPTQITLLGRHPQPVILRQRFQRRAPQPINPGITDMEHMRLRAFNNQGAQRAHITPILVIAILAAAGLRIEPGVGRRQDTLNGFFYRPGF